MPLYNSDVYISIATPNIYWAHPRYSDFRQTNDQRSSRRNGNFFFRPIQREEVSSLVPAGFAVIHHPPLRACSRLLRNYPQHFSQEKVEDIADELTDRDSQWCGPVLSGAEECLRQFGCPKHIRDAL
jgi:hypothetical protein